MKKILFIFLLIYSGNAFAQYVLKDLQVLYPLKGSWESTRKKGILTEVWKIENDSTLLGHSYIKVGADSIPQERVELVLRNGKIFYIPTTANQNNQQPVSFALIQIDNGKYIFENKEHDFPQLINYQLVDHNTLHASIAGFIKGRDGKAVMTYLFKRIN